MKIVALLHGWLQGEGSCACSAGRAADPPTASTAKPIPAKRAGGAGRKRQKMQKVNTIVLELECVLCGLVAAADLQLSGGPAGRVQQETNQLVRLVTCIYWNIP